MKKIGVAADVAEKALLGTSLLTMAALAIGLIVTSPANASGDLSMSSAEKVRRLDIMLMVTGLRCRNTPDNFTVEYRRFTTNHIGELNAAAAQLRGQMATRYGSGGAERALDRLSVTMANSYGQGHPWLNCGQLKMAAASLADMRGGTSLVEAADQLLSSQGSGQLALRER